MNEERLSPSEENELQRLREIWRRDEDKKRRPPLAPEQLMAQVRAGHRSPALLAQAATRRQLLQSLTLLLACCLTGLLAARFDSLPLGLLALLLGAPALWQSIGEGCRLFLYRSLNERDLSPSAAERLALRLLRAEERRRYRQKRLQQLFSRSPLPLQPLRRRFAGAATACCLLVCLGTTLWHHQSQPEPGRDISWGTLQCNNDCSDAQVRDNLYHLIYRA